jgi:hypothetical protein
VFKVLRGFKDLQGLQVFLAKKVTKETKETPD